MYNIKGRKKCKACASAWKDGTARLNNNWTSGFTLPIVPHSVQTDFNRLIANKLK
jgi:hypothetical protein